MDISNKVDTGIILCGGQSSRMSFKNKCLLKLGNKTFIEITIEKLKKIFPHVILVARDQSPYLHLGEKIVTDVYHKRSSLTGIHAGLKACPSKYSFIIGCDTPLFKVQLMEFLISQLTDKCDIVVPKIKGYYEPLGAIYSKDCVPYIEKLLDQKLFKISNIFSLVNTKIIGEDLIKKIDPHLISFFNVNTEQDYNKVLEIYLNVL